MNENILLGLLIFIFVLFIILNRVLAGKPIERIITEAGLGSLLAGTFFGVVREVLLKRPANNKLTMTFILFFFVWYILTKGLSTLFVEGGFKDMTGNLYITDDKNIDDKNEIKSKASIQKKKLPEIYSVFVAAIITMLVVILLVSFYAQRKEGSDKHIVNYNIMITVMVILAGFFTFMSGKKLDYEIKIKILSYTISFALIFGIFTPIFLFKSFTFTSLILSSLIFFVWLTLTFSISNFVTVKPDYIKRN